MTIDTYKNYYRLLLIGSKSLYKPENNRLSKINCRIINKVIILCFDSIRYYYNCSYISTLRCLHCAYIVFINRCAEKLYDFVRLVLYFASLSKADSIIFEIHQSPPDHSINLKLFDFDNCYRGEAALSSDTASPLNQFKCCVRNMSVLNF